MAAIENPIQPPTQSLNSEFRSGRDRPNGTLNSLGGQPTGRQDREIGGAHRGRRRKPRQYKNPPQELEETHTRQDRDLGSPAHQQAQDMNSDEPRPSARGGRNNRRGRPGSGGNGRSHLPPQGQTEASQEQTWQQQLQFSAPASEEAPASATNQALQSSSTRGRGRGGRGGGLLWRNQRRNRQAIQESANSSPTRVFPPTRKFGSRLTTDENPQNNPGPSVPVTITNSTPPAEDEFPAFGRDTKSSPSEPMTITLRTSTPRTGAQAEDLMTKIHKGLASGSYECMICYGGVTRRTPIWDCERCFAVFHLHCIHKWAEHALEAHPPPNSLENGLELSRTWRCPGCQNPSEEAPTTYTCWCGKQQHPEPARFIPPHSCGQTCGKPRSGSKCPHACNLQCHAGPCPPCTALGPLQSCYCGKHTIQRKCVDTDYENGWSCQLACEDMMPCGEHQCSKPCHPGLCGECEYKENLRCYCGKQEKGIKCCDKSEPIASKENNGEDIISWFGHWSCGAKCNRLFDCGVHRCKKECHPIDPEPAHCPLSPDLITCCPCGKTALAEILPSPRTSCEDPIPSCGKKCGKTLRCGHECRKFCHQGDCGICLETVEILCRCGRTPSRSMCHQGQLVEPPHCMKTCKTTLNCGRHECGEKCCSGEAAAIERERMTAAKKKKIRRLGVELGRTEEENFEPEHICTRPCGKLLKCGTHICPAVCHRGPCGSCLEATWEELACHCGKTVTPPPIRCGTAPPTCQFPCVRPKNCGHPMVPHSCHTDEENCPKCPYLTTKKCICGRNEIRNHPCWRDLVSCGVACGKKLSCGSHVCKRTCHADGKCDEPCAQLCGKTKSCGHNCTEPCHAPYQCPENSPCQAKIQLNCSCRGIKQEAKCNATKNNPGNKRELKCNDQCRARRMALALDIDPDRDALSGHKYSDETIAKYIENKQFAQSVEKALRSFSDSPSKRYAFQPMKSSQREVIHLIAADYGLDSESQDPEPYRNVVVFKGSKFLSAPRKTIAEYIQSLRNVTAAPTAAPVPRIEQLQKPGKRSHNAIILQGIRVGLLTTELEKELDPVLKLSQLRFLVHWTRDEEVILEPKAGSFGPDELDLELSTLKPAIKRVVALKSLAQNVDLCWIGKDGNVVPPAQRWSGAALSRGTTSKPSSGAISFQNGFSLLDPNPPRSVPSVRSSESLRDKERKEKDKKKKQAEVEVVDDWEMAAEDVTVEEVEHMKEIAEQRSKAHIPLLFPDPIAQLDVTE